MIRASLNTRESKCRTCPSTRTPPLLAACRSRKTGAPPPPTSNVHQRHGDRASGDDDDEPKLLPVYVRYHDLVGAGIVGSWAQLNRMIAREDFPAGQLLSPNIRAWRLSTVQRWLDTRPAARKKIPETARRPRRKLQP
jgi:hypothetical protein